MLIIQNVNIIHGNSPEKLFPLRASTFKDAICPISFGIFPIILLEDNVNSSSFFKFPISEGNFPESLFDS